LTDERTNGAEVDVADVLTRAHASWTRGDRTGAVAMLQAFAVRAPATPVLARLGVYALETGDNAGALGWLDRAVAIAPGDAIAWTNLGTAFLRLARIDEAITAYRKAQAIDPAAIGPCVNLGNALQQSGDIDGAVATLETARRLSPDAPEVLNNLGNLYKEQGRFDAAWAAYEAARVAQPGFRPAFSNLLALTKLSTRHSPAEVFALHRAFAERFEYGWAAEYLPAANTPDRDRRLRIGYVSPDCHTALPAFVEPVLRRHDRARFDVFAYFNNPQSAETLARLGPIEAKAMKGASDETVARWIRDDAIDILIDIAGHTGHNRLGVFGCKPAPVQITWLDYLNTTGLDAIDYRLTDAVSDPHGASDALHSEALVRLTPAQWCWSPPDGTARPSPLPALSAGRLTLGSFNNFSKLTDATLALWSRVLAAVPNCELVIVGAAQGMAQDRVRAAFGDAARRVRVVPRLAPDAFRREAATVDIALDPLPFSGATTTLEALWQGVPVVTLPGATSASRSTASLLTALGLADWIARDADDYVAIVLRAAMAPETLATLRAALPARLHDSALCDAERFTRQLEGVLRDAWRTWCTNRHARVAASTAAKPAPHAAPSTRAALRRIDGDARLSTIETLLRAGNGVDAVDAVCALVDEFPEWQAAQRAYLRTLLAWSQTQPGLVSRMFPAAPAPARPPRVSALICSIDPRRFDAVTARYRRRFEGWPLEIVGVHDARSLAEGYNRAAAHATGDILVFSHDDIELVTPDFAARLAAHLDRFDGVGVAGASQVIGPRFGDAGQRASHGHILHAPPPGRSGALLMVSGFQQPVCENIRVLDGVFIAVRRHVWEANRFDGVRYDGFHLYDLDFTWRASNAGARLAVATDLLIHHASQGRYDDAWRRYARRFVEQAGLDPLHAPRPGGLQTRLDTQQQIDALRAAMLHFRYGAPVAR
jgi:predicted O-linked N-acetylglucosamine transferase (SPINDLY family)